MPVKMADVDMEPKETKDEEVEAEANGAKGAESTPAAGRARRERKQTQFFKPVTAPVDKDAFEIKQGKGKKLAEIPNVAFHLSKITGRDELLEDLHTLLYKRKGKLSTRKRDIGSFSGFVFEDKAEREKAEERLSKWTVEHLHGVMDLLDIPRGAGDKSAKVSKVMDFLEKPKVMSDVDLAEREAKKKAKKASKRKQEAKKKDAKPVKKAGRGKKTKEEEEEEESEEDAEEGSESEAEEGAEKQEEGAAAGEDKGEKVEAAAAELPGDEELTAKVVEVLKMEDPEKFTVKDILNKLAAAYPGVDIKKKKALIKGVALDWVADNPAPTKGEEQAAGNKTDEAADDKEEAAATADDVGDKMAEDQKPAAEGAPKAADEKAEEAALAGEKAEEAAPAEEKAEEAE